MKNFFSCFSQCSHAEPQHVQYWRFIRHYAKKCSIGHVLTGRAFLRIYYSADNLFKRMKKQIWCRKFLGNLFFIDVCLCNYFIKRRWNVQSDSWDECFLEKTFIKLEALCIFFMTAKTAKHLFCFFFYQEMYL